MGHRGECTSDFIPVITTLDAIAEVGHGGIDSAAGIDILTFLRRNDPWGTSEIVVAQIVVGPR